MSGFSLGKSPDDGVSMLDSVDMEEEGEGVATGRETSQLETGYKPVNSSTPMLGTKGKSSAEPISPGDSSMNFRAKFFRDTLYKCHSSSFPDNSELSKVTS